MLKIKFCGMTRREDVLAAVELGVDAVGVVFHQSSPRYVTVEQAGMLLRNLPPFVARVGVFVEPQTLQILEFVQRAGLTAVQVYGGPTTEALWTAGCRVPVVRALHAGADLHAQLSAYVEETVLIDAASQTTPGGTGRTWDWSTLKSASRPRQLMLAGGLNAGNVYEAVTRVKPDAVDVSSGVEKSPGVKDPARMAAFVKACSPFRHSLKEPM